MTIAVEIGFGDVKVLTREMKFKFPSVVAWKGNGMLRNWEETGGYVFEGKEYVVGDEAMGHPEMFASREPGYLIDFAPLFLFKAFELAGRKYDRVGLGLAVGHYNKSQSLKKRVSSFEVNGEKVTINDCSILPQGAGIWFDWKKNKGSKIDGNYMVLDIGFNTVDVVIAKKGAVVKEGSWMLEGEGIIKIVRSLRDYIQEKAGVRLFPHEAKKILEERKIVSFGKERNLEKVITRLSEEYTKRLFKLITQESREELIKVNGFIIGGGGAYYVAPNIPREFKGYIEIVEEPEFANARGFLEKLTRREDKNEKVNGNSYGQNVFVSEEN